MNIMDGVWENSAKASALGVPCVGRHVASAHAAVRAISNDIDDFVTVGCDAFERVCEDEETRALTNMIMEDTASTLAPRAAAPALEAGPWRHMDCASGRPPTMSPGVCTAVVRKNRTTPCQSSS